MSSKNVSIGSTVTLSSIKGVGAFKRVLDGGSRFVSRSVVAFVVFRDDVFCLDHTLYYGVGCSKRLSRKAVVRNRVKRLLRESVRLIVKRTMTGSVSDSRYSGSVFFHIDSIILFSRVAPEVPSLLRLDDVIGDVDIIFYKIFGYIKKNLS